MLMKNDSVEQVRLTSLATCAGCAAKLPQAMLQPLLDLLPRQKSANLLVDSSTCDDAGVYRISPKLALVQTVDFFTPIVDDPFTFGAVAATNAISDVYAMGGRPITAMNLLAVPADKVSPETIAMILKGGAAKARDADCVVVGGHTIRTQEPIYGMAVTGVIDPKRMLTNATARAGDVLVLTKPLGTGIATTAIKRGLASPGLTKRVAKVMLKLNWAGYELAQSRLVKTATDVTGFGLLGHLANICRASGVLAEINEAAVPVISREVLELIEQDCIPGGTRSNLEAAEAIVDFDEKLSRTRRVLLADAQTSGGLLLAVAPNRLAKVMRVLKRNRSIAGAVIGRVMKSKEPRIVVRP